MEKETNGKTIPEQTSNHQIMKWLHPLSPFILSILAYNIDSTAILHSQSIYERLPPTKRKKQSIDRVTAHQSSVTLPFRGTLNAVVGGGKRIQHYLWKMRCESGIDVGGEWAVLSPRDRDERMYAEGL